MGTGVIAKNIIRCLKDVLGTESFLVLGRRQEALDAMKGNGIETRLISSESIKEMIATC